MNKSYSMIAGTDKMDKNRSYMRFFYEVKGYFSCVDMETINEKMDFVIQFDVIGDCGGVFYVAYNSGRLAIEPYQYFDNSVRIQASASTIMKLAMGEITILRAMCTGYINIIGKSANSIKGMALFFEACHHMNKVEDETQNADAMIEEEFVSMNNLVMSHIVQKNPIMIASDNLKWQYMSLLKKYVRVGGWYRRKYVKAQLKAYETILDSEESQENQKTEADIAFYRYYILFDLLQILGYDPKLSQSEKMAKVLERYYADFPDMVKEKLLVEKICRAAGGSDKNWKDLKRNYILRNQGYLFLAYKNVKFRKRKPFTIVVTATMSAGKSTFINAVTGKYINLSQNMACTSKVHSIIGKPFEDGFSYEDDHELVLTAGREELLNDNEENNSDKIVVSTYFQGELGGERIIIHDSPGVNFSGDAEHKEISDRLIRSRKYRLLIYLMNATQLGTNDEEEHLDYVKNNIGRTPILFLVNKIDAFDAEEESVSDALKRQTEYLKTKGFKNPVVCPVSSRAGYLAKAFQQGELSKLESRELYNYVDKFEQMRLQDYYRKFFPAIRIEDADSEEKQLLKTCGIAYVEKIMKKIIRGGK